MLITKLDLFILIHFSASDWKDHNIFKYNLEANNNNYKKFTMLVKKS